MNNSRFAAKPYGRFIEYRKSIYDLLLKIKQLFVNRTPIKKTPKH